MIEVPENKTNFEFIVEDYFLLSCIVINFIVMLILIYVLYKQMKIRKRWKSLQ
jgi:hypothetical protein